MHRPRPSIMFKCYSNSQFLVFQEVSPKLCLRKLTEFINNGSLLLVDLALDSNLRSALAKINYLGERQHN